VILNWPEAAGKISTRVILSQLLNAEPELLANPFSDCMVMVSNGGAVPFAAVGWENAIRVTEADQSVQGYAIPPIGLDTVDAMLRGAIPLRP